MKHRRSDISLTAFYIRKSTPFLIHYLLFFTAFVFGCFSVIFGINDSCTLISNSISDICGNPFWKNFLSYFVFCLSFSFVMVLAGLCFFGSPITVFVFVLYGLANGTIFSCICKLYGITGILINGALFFVPAVLGFFLFALMSTVSVNSSVGIVKSVVSDHYVSGLKNRVSDMVYMFLISIPCHAVVSVIYSLSFKIFSGVFFA